MYDALAPACDALDDALGGGSRPRRSAGRRRGAAADAGRDATIPMLARKGRATYLGERSVGHQDPGATSTALLVAQHDRAGLTEDITPMVGIVVVSHSRALARAAVALAAEMLHGKALRIAVAAGLDERTFGTDAVRSSTPSTRPTTATASSC